ncbi:hypothetical protein T492DRAFT_838023 [Pavlovales sp. CCMP2436]|nr:hypothetical protein T492DRAFT_838023 [Pavlovales sp. CCMP2436]
MSRNNRNPYARKFANVYAQVVDVAVVKTSDLQAWTLTLNDALMQYGNSRFFGNVEIDGNLLAHNRAMFESPATFTHSVYLPTLTYLDGSLLEPTKVAITGCTASDSWLVETDNTGSEIQVQATAGFDPITVGARSTVWPSATWSVYASSTAISSAADNAFDKSATTRWVSSNTSYNANNGYGGAFVTIQYPVAVVMKSFTLTNSPDVAKFQVQGSLTGSSYVNVQYFSRAMSAGVEAFTITNIHPPYQYWRLIVTNISGGATFCSVGEWELMSSRGLISLVSAQPTSLSTFKLVLADSEGTPVSTAGLAQDWDVHLCLTKGGKVANSGLYRFAPGASGSLGVEISDAPAEVMYTVLRPYARKFANAYARVAEVNAVKVNDSADVMGDLLVRGAAFLPTLTYLNGTLLEAPISIAITGCTSSDSWLVETDNTGSEFQVQATAAFTPITVGNTDAMCKVSPRFTSSTAILTSTLWPLALGWYVSASTAATNTYFAFDKNTATSWTTNANTYNTTTGQGNSWIQILYPHAVSIKSSTLTNSPDLRQVRLECSPNGVYYSPVQSWTRTMTSDVEAFPVTVAHPPVTFWRISIPFIATGGNSFCSVGEWELTTQRGLISLVSAEPTSLSAFKLVMADPQGTPVSTADITQDWDVHICLTKDGQIANSGLYRFAPGNFGRAGKGMYTVLRPYARKTANAYAQEAEVNAVRVFDSADVTNFVVRSKTDMSGTILMRGAATFGAAKFSGGTTFEGPAEMMSTVLMRGAATFGGQVEMMGDLGPITIMGPVDLMGTLLMRGTSVFNGKVDMMGDLLVRGAAFLPTLTYLNGTLLEAPISIAITGCTTSDSWLVETDNTESEFQVQATAAFNPVTVGATDAMCKASPKFNTNFTIAFSALWPVGLNGWQATASTSNASSPYYAFDKNTTTSWTSNASTFNTTTGYAASSSSWVQVMYPYAVNIRSFTLTNSPDVRTVRLECSPNGTYYNTVQSWTRTMTSGVESFPLTIGNYPNQFWRLMIISIATGGNSYCSVGDWELFSSRGPVSLMSAVPISLSTFKLMLTDSQGIIINMTGIAQELDINLCLTKGGKVANSGLYRFGPGASGSLGVVTKLS